jgi:hypothetical protein
MFLNQALMTRRSTPCRSRTSACRHWLLVREETAVHDESRIHRGLCVVMIQDFGSICASAVWTTMSKVWMLLWMASTKEL